MAKASPNSDAELRIKARHRANQKVGTSINRWF